MLSMTAWFLVWGKNDQLEMTVFVRVRAKTSNNKGNRRSFDYAALRSG